MSYVLRIENDTLKLPSAFMLSNMKTQDGIEGCVASLPLVENDVVSVWDVLPDGSRRLMWCKIVCRRQLSPFDGNYPLAPWQGERVAL